MAGKETDFLRDVLKAPPARPAEAAAPEAPDESGLPATGSDYKPHSSAANKSVFTLNCIKREGIIRGFQYVDLDSDSHYEPGVIRIRFSGTKVMEVVIHGRSLRKLYDDIHRHVTLWVMEAPRDMAKDGDCHISRIDISQIKKEKSVNEDEAQARQGAEETA